MKFYPKRRLHFLFSRMESIFARLNWNFNGSRQNVRFPAILCSEWSRFLAPKNFLKCLKIKKVSCCKMTFLLNKNHSFSKCCQLFLESSLLSFHVYWKGHCCIKWLFVGDLVRCQILQNTALIAFYQCLTWSASERPFPRKVENWSLLRSISECRGPTMSHITRKLLEPKYTKLKP